MAEEQVNGTGSDEGPSLPDLPDFEESETVETAASLKEVLSNLNICKCRNPLAAFFHCVFKVLAILVYLFVGFFTEATFIIIFVLCIIFMALDFWAVKNISGRFLVGLMYFNEIDEEGKSVWRFTTRSDPEFSVDPIDSLIFWVVLFLYPTGWVVLAVLSIIWLKFSWVLVCTFGVVFAVPNIWGYILCQKLSSGQIKKYLAGQVMKRVLGGLLSRNN